MAVDNVQDISTVRRTVTQGDEAFEPVDVNLEDLPEEMEFEIDEGGEAGLFEEEPERVAASHDDNLAIALAEADPAALEVFGLELIEAVDNDKKSRSDWEEVFQDGLKLMGIQGSENGSLTESEEDDVFKGASKLFHPLITEACIQFQSEALKAMLPPKGPVGTDVIGDETPEKLDQARRVKGFMNYQVTHEIRGYFEEHDKLLAYLGKSGSAFKKCHYDANRQRIAVTYLPAEQVIVPYNAKSMDDAERITHIETAISRARMEHRMASGLYRDVPITPATPKQEGVAETLAAQQGSSQVELIEDDQYTVYEIHVETVVPMFEGDRGNLSAPYIVHVEAESGTVLGIFRNWREADPVYERRDYFVHYPLVQSDGFYGYGFIHLLGQLAKGASGTLRQLLDAGTLSTLQGGFKRKGTRIANDGQGFEPGEYRDVEVMGEKIQDSIMHHQFKEPSNVLFQLMGFLVEAGRRMVSLTDLNVGDGNQEAPVGTTIALLERGMNVMSAVHMRLCRAMKQELQIIARIAAENLPEEYPYDVPGETRSVFKADFDDRVDVVPTCDPRQFSQAQRIARAQNKLQLAQQFPEIFNKREAARDMMMEIDDSNVDRLLPPEAEAKPTGPMQENMDSIMGKPLKAFMEQNHDAHMAAHTAHLQNPQFAENMQLQQALQAHIQEHMAMKYQVQMMQAMGVESVEQLEQMPPEQVAVLAAQATQQITGQAQALAEAEARAAEPTLEQQALLKEIENDKAEIQRKAMKDMQDAAAKASELAQDRELESASILQRDRAATMSTAAKVFKDQQDGVISLISALQDKQQKEQERDRRTDVV